MAPTAHPPSSLDLSDQQVADNEIARAAHTAILFNPNLTTTGTLADGFRVFSIPQARMNHPALRQHERTPEQNPAPIIVYTDGSCLHNGAQNAQAGSGIWYGHLVPRNRSLRLPGPHQSNQVGEITAVLETVKMTPLSTPLHICSDSQYVIDGLTKHLPTWEDRGWIGISNKLPFQATAAHLRRRSSETTFGYVQAHNGDLGNEGADAEAGKGARKDAADLVSYHIPARFNLTGAKLSTATQALLYQGIKEQLDVPIRQAALIHLDITRYAVEELSGTLPTDASIWKSLTHKDLTKKIQIFYWRIMHGSLRIGPYWRNIPDNGPREFCPVCENESETMEHILLECKAPGQEIIWQLTHQLWLLKHPVWPELTYGTILGCTLAAFKDANDHALPGANRLYRILISESAHLIWRIRCERRISRLDDPARHDTTTELESAWSKVINSRLKIDRLLTNKHKYNKRALPPAHVLRTWNSVLTTNGDLSDDWLQQSGVLVGMQPPRPPGRNR